MMIVQVNLDMTDSMGPGKLVCRMQNLSYTYDEYLICIGLGPSISSVIRKNLLYSGPSYPSSPVVVMIIINDHAGYIDGIMISLILQIYNLMIFNDNVL